MTITKQDDDYTSAILIHLFVDIILGFYIGSILLYSYGLVLDILG